MRATTRRPVAQFDVIRVLAMNASGTQTCNVPQRYTLAEIQECVDNRVISGTVQIRCTSCGESVFDCPELSVALHGVPAEWGWEYRAQHAYDQ